METAFQQKGFFKVPVCKIESKKNANEALLELDHNTSENKVGDIINLSQKLNNILWDLLDGGCGYEGVQELYEDICKLAVLSGIEIDKAKRAFANVEVAKEWNKISTEYKTYKQDDNAKPLFPEFFKEVGNGTNQERKYTFYNAPMEYIYKSVGDIDFRQGRVGHQEFRPISDMLEEPKKRSALPFMTIKRK